MYKLLIVLVLAASCTEHKTTVTTTPAADTLMDSTSIKMKADTTVKMLDHLQDSIDQLRNKAADQKN